MRTPRIFNEKDVVNRYKLKEILAIHNNQSRTLFDFLPFIFIGVSWEEKILENWKQYFKKKKIPWAVTSNGSRLTLWKEKYVE